MPNKTTKQHKRIFYLASQLCWDIDRLREMVAEWTGSRISKLTYNQADLVIKNMKISLQKTRPAVVNRPGKMSEAQRKKIIALKTIMDWSDDQVNGMSARVAKCDHWQWLDGAGAYKVIESMRSIYKREHGVYPEKYKADVPF